MESTSNNPTATTKAEETAQELLRRENSQVSVLADLLPTLPVRKSRTTTAIGSLRDTSGYSQASNYTDSANQGKSDDDNHNEKDAAGCGESSPRPSKRRLWSEAVRRRLRQATSAANSMLGNRSGSISESGSRRRSSHAKIRYHAVGNTNISSANRRQRSSSSYSRQLLDYPTVSIDNYGNSYIKATANASNAGRKRSSTTQPLSNNNKTNTTTTTTRTQLFQNMSIFKPDQNGERLGGVMLVTTTTTTTLDDLADGEGVHSNNYNDDNINSINNMNDNTNRSSEILQLSDNNGRADLDDNRLLSLMLPATPPPVANRQLEEQQTALPISLYRLPVLDQGCCNSSSDDFSNLDDDNLEDKLRKREHSLPINNCKPLHGRQKSMPHLRSRSIAIDLLPATVPAVPRSSNTAVPIILIAKNDETGSNNGNTTTPNILASSSVTLSMEDRLNRSAPYQPLIDLFDRFCYYFPSRPLLTSRRQQDKQRLRHHRNQTMQSIQFTGSGNTHQHLCQPPYSASGSNLLFMGVLPKRWLSLRNVIACINIIILLLAITAISTVSYLAGQSSTRTAISAMSNVTINLLTSQLDNLLSNAENANIFTKSVMTTSEYAIGNTVKNMRLLYYYQSQTDYMFDQVYAVAPDNTFAGVGLNRFPDGSSIDPQKFLVKYLNRTTRPWRLVYEVDSSCQANDTSCVMQAFQPNTEFPLQPIQNTTYIAAQRPFYQIAVRNARPGWSPVYQYANVPRLGLTATNPTYVKGRLQFVAAIDITLNSLQEFLWKTAGLLAGDNGPQSTPLLFIVETESGYMVANSAGYPVVDRTTMRRILSSDTDSPIIKLVTENLLSIAKNFTDIKWPAKGYPLVFSAHENQLHVVVGPYRRALGDIDWLLVACIPYDAYNGSLVSAQYIQIPIVALAVLLVSTVLSVLITRSIGRPLKKIAKEMLDIADLNFITLNDDCDDISIEQDEQHSGGSIIAATNATADNLNVNTADYPLDSQQTLINGAPDSRNRRKRNDGGTNALVKEIKELRYLRHSVDAMKSGLRSFAKYVPMDIVALLLKMKREAVLGVDEMEITVLFSDIVNFTTIAESMPPKKLVELMGEYLSEMSDIILQSQGVVDKYIGDAIMAFWNAPLALRDHPTLACSVALKSQQRLGEMRKRWLQRGLPEIRARIGINTGPALVGNLGSTTRLNYTCLGDTVNLASRLETLNKKYQTAIIISENTYEKIHKEFFVVRPLDVVAVKGKANAVKVYELIGFRKLMAESAVKAIEEYNRSFDAFVGGNFSEAAFGFESYLQHYDPLDRVAKDHFDCCKERIKSKTKRDWDYTVVLDEK